MTLEELSKYITGLDPGELSNLRSVAECEKGKFDQLLEGAERSNNEAAKKFMRVAKIIRLGQQSQEGIGS